MNLNMEMDTDMDIGMNKAFYMDTDHGHRRLAQSFEMALPRHFLKDLDVGKSLIRYQMLFVYSTIL